jgi:uncharacterized protein YceK
MKKKLFSFAIFFTIVLSGCSSASDRPVPQQQGYEVTGRQADFIPGATSDSDAGITVLNVKRTVKPGGKGGLSIQGVPNTNYTVTANYINSRGMMTASAAKHAGNDGKVSWEWNVKEDTLPGNYLLLVSGGGKKITTSYTVEQ